MQHIPSDSSLADVPSYNGAFTSPRRRWWRAALVILGAAFLLLPGLAVVKIATEPRSITGRPNLGEVTMPDGTVLVFEQLTLNDKHRFEFDLSRGSAIGNWLTGKASRTTSKPSVSLSPSNGAMVVWFTRWDRRTGAAHGFDWWQATVLVDETGEEVADAMPRLISSNGTGVSSRSTFTPRAITRGVLRLPESSFKDSFHGFISGNVSSPIAGRGAHPERVCEVRSAESVNAALSLWPQFRVGRIRGNGNPITCRSVASGTSRGIRRHSFVCIADAAGIA